MMPDKKMTTRDTIEETGKVFRKFGLTPMQGRIVAFFTISDPPEKTFDELKEYAYRTLSMRTPEYPVSNEKVLKWIENANRFQESLENTLDSMQKDSFGNS